MGAIAQCKALTGSADATADQALETIGSRFDFVCTTSQLDLLSGYLKSIGVMSRRSRRRISYKSPYVPRASQQNLEQTMVSSVREDLKLFQQIFSGHLARNHL